MTTATPTITAEPSPSTAVCPVCQLDRDAACQEGLNIASTPKYLRSVGQNRRMRELLRTLERCQAYCGAAGGWGQ